MNDQTSKNTKPIAPTVKLIRLNPDNEDDWFSDSGRDAWNRSPPPANWSARMEEDYDPKIHVPSVRGIVPPPPAPPKN